MTRPSGLGTVEEANARIVQAQQDLDTVLQSAGILSADNDPATVDAMAQALVLARARLEIARLRLSAAQAGQYGPPT